MAAACLATRERPRVDFHLFDSNPHPGKKLLITGSGLCNLTHRGEAHEFLSHYGENGKFLGPSLRALPPQKLLEFFSRFGIDFQERENGKIFPKSGGAQALLSALSQSACEERFSGRTRITQIEAAEEGGFHLQASGPETDEEVFAESLILATGGLSYPSTGSTGEGLSFAGKLGHRIVEPRPALCGVLSGGMEILAGNSFRNVKVRLLRCGKVLRAAQGDFLFTHRGVSGPVILDLSRFISRDDELEINFLPAVKAEPFFVSFAEGVRRLPAERISAYLSSFELTRSLVQFILTRSGIEREKRCGDLDKKQVRRLSENIVRFTLPVEGLEGYNAAMATAGGVSLEEVDPKTLESRIVPGLYFAGEVLDIDGDTGGYNLQAAFSTGYLAALSCAERGISGLRK